MAAHTYKSYLSSFDDPDVIEVSPAARGWDSGSHHKRERSKVVIESDDEPEGVMINGDEISVEKNKKADVHPIDWPNHSKSSLLHDVAGSSSHTFTKKVSWSGTFTKSNPWSGSTFTKAKPWPGTIKKNPDPWFGHKLEHEESASNYLDGWPYEGYEHDYAYDEDKYEDDGYDALLFESEYNYSLTTKFDGLGAPSAEASLPWPQKTSVENASKAKPTKIMIEKTDEKYAAFKQFDDPDVIEVSPAARGRASGHQKRKRSKVVIESDDDDEPEWVMINGDKTSVEKNKKAVVHPIDWPKHSESSLLHDAAGSRSRTFTKKVPWPGTFIKSNPWPGTFIKSNPWPGTFTKSNPWPDTFLKKPAPWFGHKLEHEESASNYSDGWPYEGYEDDYAYDEDEYEDDVYDALPFESEYNSSLATEFDGAGAPGAEASLPWLQKTSIENAIKAKPTKIMNEKTDEKYKAFKQFDTVDDHSDHYYSKPELRKVQIVKKPQKDWTKRVQREWKILKKDLPDTIFVRAYEERMDLLRAVIMGPAGTPYHDGLFFFDIYLPPQYPNVPPLVNYRAGGLRLNPNLYACGKVCLSLLNTWSGSGCEKWNPSNSTMMQVLVSIQALVLNAKPYFNEPGYAMDASTPHGEKKSLTYNEDTFLLSCRTMLYSLRNPPKNFEDFVAGHFRKSGRNILVACRAYLEGAQVGCLVGNGAQDVDEGDKSCSVRFKHSLKRLYEELVIELSGKGADCDEFLSQKAGSESSTAAADTTLRL